MRLLRAFAACVCCVRLMRAFDACVCCVRLMRASAACVRSLRVSVVIPFLINVVSPQIR